MEAEERYLLPLVEAQSPAEVALTRAEHARIRDLLCELGVAVELHTVRETDVRKLIELLQAHAKREEAALYALAGEKASVAVEHSISSALKAVVRSALRVTNQETPNARNPVRNESLSQAVELDRRLRKLWQRHPRFTLVPHTTSFLKKIVGALGILETLVDGAAAG